LDEAEGFRRRRRTAERRLAWAFGSTTGLAGVLAALIVVLLTGLGQHQPGELERKVEHYRLREGATVAARLHEWPPGLRSRRDELEGFYRDPEFKSLPDDLRAFVLDRRRELDEYIPYLEEVLATRFPSIAHTAAERAPRGRELERALALPHEDWDESGAGKLRRQRLEDLRLLSERANAAEGWYLARRREGVQLWTLRQPPRVRSRQINWGE